MGVTATNALITVTDGAGLPVAIANGGIALVTAGNQITIALTSTTGVAAWDLRLNAPSFSSLNNVTFSWKAGQANIFQFTMPDNAPATTSPYAALQFISVVSDGVSSIAQALGYIQSIGGAVPLALQHVATLLAGVALAAYTNVNGVITANGNGIMASVDSVVPTVGMTIFLPPGIAAAAVDVGLYQVTSIGTAGTPFILTRAGDMAQGAFYQQGEEVHVLQGTVYAGTTWVLTTVNPAIVGTTTVSWYPREVIQSVTLIAGTTTITNVPILSATKTIATAERTTANTSTATTGGYNTVGGKTPGNLGTASLVFDATVAAGTINNADISTLAVSIRNPV